MGDLNYPLVSDLKREISQKYGVLSEEGVALRGLFIIDKEVRPDACTAHPTSCNRVPEPSLQAASFLYSDAAYLRTTCAMRGIWHHLPVHAVRLCCWPVHPCWECV